MKTTVNGTEKYRNKLQQDDNKLFNLPRRSHFCLLP